MAEAAGDVTIANPGSWVGRTAELVEQLRVVTLRSDARTVPDLSGRPVDAEQVMTITDPAYWVDRPFELDEVLKLAALPEATAEAAAPDRVAGAASAADGRLTMSVEEAAAALGISRALAYEAAKRSEIPVIRIGRRMLVPRAALTRLLDQAESQRGEDR